METVLAIFEIVRRLARDMGPYLLVEILLPGGSLIAIALLLYRRRESLLSPMSISVRAKRL
ncbi:MAG TPA: hypothetical protein VFJ70_10400 [Burkholderiales bacterium]|nr:hypothetical protein [Burkholderiales bacterium]